jgi:pimeloyl-ACP methyl ester carboxylesterase
MWLHLTTQVLETPTSSPDEFNYTFDRLSEIIEDFLNTIGFTHFGLYMQDYGGPVGFRIITRKPQMLEWLVIQNANAYEVGFTNVGNNLVDAVSKNRTPETEERLNGFLQLDTIRQIYLYGHKNPEAISPDNWNMDFRFSERPKARTVQIDLFYDYPANIALYPKWQKFLHDHQPKSLILWGQNDIFFTREGGEAYLKDRPSAEYTGSIQGTLLLRIALMRSSIAYTNSTLTNITTSSGSLNFGNPVTFNTIFCMMLFYFFTGWSLKKTKAYPNGSIVQNI